ncbi:hypothetical protein GCM10027290_68530 [Micromonospora sonneratiae]
MDGVPTITPTGQGLKKTTIIDRARRIMMRRRRRRPQLNIDRIGTLPIVGSLTRQPLGWRVASGLRCRTGRTLHGLGY